MKIEKAEYCSRIDFEELLQKELDKLPYTKHLDDGQQTGFELGARWAFGLFAVSG